MIRPTILATLFFLFVVFNHTAQAYGPWEVGRAQAVAAKAWPDSPCATQRVTIIQEPQNEAFSGILAFVMGDDTGRPVEGCQIHLTADLRAREWPDVCTVMIHEYGHLDSKPHETAGIMRPDPSAETDPRCIDRGRVFLGMKPSKAYERLRATFLDGAGGYQ